MTPFGWLAHGAVGPLDEVTLVLTPVVLLAMLLRSRPTVDARDAGRDPPATGDEEQ